MQGFPTRLTFQFSEALVRFLFIKV